MNKINEAKKYYIEDGSLKKIAKNTYEVSDSEFVFSTDDLNEARKKFDELKYRYGKVEKTPHFIQIIEFSAGTLANAKKQDCFDFDVFDDFTNR